MKDTEYKLLDPIADVIYDKFEQLVNSKELDEIKSLLKDAIEKLPDNYTLDLNVVFNVFNGEKENVMPLLQTGITTAGGEPYPHSGDSTRQKYLIDGQIYIAPDDYCPSCWGEWDNKMKETSCPECDIQLGKGIMLMIDDDICPWCKEGKVTINEPICQDCGYEVEKDKVVWG